MITDIMALHKVHRMVMEWVDIEPRDHPNLIGKDQTLVAFNREQLLATWKIILGITKVKDSHSMRKGICKEQIFILKNRGNLFMDI